MCNIGSPDWPAFQSQPGLCRPHLGPTAGVWLSPAIGAPRDWWQLFTDEAVFIIPVQGCTDQMDPDHPSTVRDTSVPVVAQSTNKSPAPWKAVVSHRGMDTDTDRLLKTREEEQHAEGLLIFKNLKGSHNPCSLKCSYYSLFLFISYEKGWHFLCCNATFPLLELGPPPHTWGFTPLSGLPSV